LEIMTPMLAAGGGTLAVLAILAAIFSAIFWMVVGWRAMKAHERLADAAEYIASKRLHVMRTILAVALAVVTLAAGNAQEGVRVLTPQDRVSEIALGDGVRARVAYDNNVKFLYLPGRAIPVHFPFGVLVSQAVVSPNRQLLLLRLMQRRLEAGSDYFACLLCRRSDTTPTAKWTVNYVLFAA